MTRPRGDVSRALLQAAKAGPAPVRVLAERALVGYSAARYTATRMVDRGELACLSNGRPAVLGLPRAPAAVAQRHASFWEVWQLPASCLAARAADAPGGFDCL